MTRVDRLRADGWRINRKRDSYDAQRCRWFHRWGEGSWIGGIADPVIRYVCRRCGATQTRRVAP